MGASPTSLVVNSAARISNVRSSIPMWILRQTRRFVPPCLRAFHSPSPLPTTRETALAALQAQLQPPAALVLRDEVRPERIPAAGLIIQRDGQPGDPE